MKAAKLRAEKQRQRQKKLKLDQEQELRNNAERLKGLTGGFAFAGTKPKDPEKLRIILQFIDESNCSL